MYSRTGQCRQTNICISQYGWLSLSSVVFILLVLTVRHSACKQWIFLLLLFFYMFVLFLLFFCFFCKKVTADIFLLICTLVIFHVSNHFDPTWRIAALYWPVYCSSGFQVLLDILNISYIYKMILSTVAAIVKLSNPTISQSCPSEGNVQLCRAVNTTCLSDSKFLTTLSVFSSLNVKMSLASVLLLHVCLLVVFHKRPLRPALDVLMYLCWHELYSHEVENVVFDENIASYIY